MKRRRLTARVICRAAHRRASDRTSGQFTRGRVAIFVFCRDPVAIFLRRALVMQLLALTNAKFEFCDAARVKKKSFKRRQRITFAIHGLGEARNLFFVQQQFALALGRMIFAGCQRNIPGCWRLISQIASSSGEA